MCTMFCALFQSALLWLKRRNVINAQVTKSGTDRAMPILGRTVAPLANYSETLSMVKDINPVVMDKLVIVVSPCSISMRS